jgi:hypothetical protein
MKDIHDLLCGQSEAPPAPFSWNVPGASCVDCECRQVSGAAGFGHATRRQDLRPRAREEGAAWPVFWRVELRGAEVLWACLPAETLDRFRACGAVADVERRGRLPIVFGTPTAEAVARITRPIARPALSAAVTRIDDE